MLRRRTLALIAFQVFFHPAIGRLGDHRDDGDKDHHKKSKSDVKEHSSFILASRAKVTKAKQTSNLKATSH